MESALLVVWGIAIGALGLGFIQAARNAEREWRAAIRRGEARQYIEAFIRTGGSA